MTDTGPISCHDCAGDLPAGWDQPCPHCGSTARESKYQPRVLPACEPPQAAAKLSTAQLIAKKDKANKAARLRYAAAKAERSKQ
jgi:hypothetical protein